MEYEEFPIPIIENTVRNLIGTLITGFLDPDSVQMTLKDAVSIPDGVIYILVELTDGKEIRYAVFVYSRRSQGFSMAFPIEDIERWEALRDEFERLPGGGNQGSGEGHTEG